MFGNFDLKLFGVFMQNTSQIFPATTGGAEQLSRDMKIPFLGKLPLDPRIGN